MANFTLTTGSDTFAGTSADDTVFGTSATLNANDSLTGGGGTDVLQLVGTGNFRVDQLATFTGFARIQTDNTSSTFANLTLGTQPIEVDATGYLQISINSTSNWNASDVVNGDPSHALYLQFNNLSPSASQSYDLTSNTLSHVNSVIGSGDKLSLTINSADAAGVALFTAFGANDQLVTGASTLDLSHSSVNGFRVASTNGVGTTFTVADLATAFQVQGGSGNDTLDAHTLALTADQRAAIFASSSIETIIDQTGTYTAPAPSPGVVGLTSGNDTFIAPSTGSIVYATAATLNAGDRLTGGAGTDVLELLGTGTFRVDQLATFTGFERIATDNATINYTNLTLGSQAIEVDATGFLAISINSASNWNASDIINGDPSHALNLEFYNQSSTAQTWDLTSNTLSHVHSVVAVSSNISFTVNSADAAGVAVFTAFGTNDQLVTGDSALDLSHTSVSGFEITSTNGAGTTFAVADLATALQVQGGPGQDTLDAHTLALTAVQRATIFATSSIETIIDQSGTYTVPAGLVSLTTGNDTIVTAPPGGTVYATAATLNAGDSLTGGSGLDVLELVGTGTFRVDQLANFTGFERIETINATTSFPSLTLGNQPIEVDATGDLAISVYAPSNWNGSDVINGDPSASLILQFENPSPTTGLTYDLTSNTLSHVDSVVAVNDNISLTINSTDAAGVAHFTGDGLNDQLVAAASTLDLSHTLVTGFRIVDSNDLGATFTVGDPGTALQVEGGSGYDTLVAQGLILTSSQRTQIFATASVEAIIDQTGTYATPGAVSIETSGSTGLTEVGSNFYLVTAGSGPELKYLGTAWTAGQWGGWTPSAAEATATGYEVAFKIGTNTYTVWNTDSHGNITTDTIGSVSGSSLTLEALETSFHQDLNNDGAIGLPAGDTLIEAFGSTSLVQTGSNFVFDKAGGGAELQYDGAAFTAGQWGGWTPIGVEATATGYEVAFKMGADTYTVWDTDANGNITVDPTGTVSGESLTLIALEKGFQQDLNGDGMIGNPAIPITVESAGSTSLVLTNGDYVLEANGTSNGPMLKIDGAAWTDGHWGGWTPVGAEATAGGYEVAFNLAGTNEYTVWNTDAAGNITTNTIGTVAGNSTALMTAETSFHQDLNGDGIIGDPLVPYAVESFGSTSLTQLGHDFFLYANGTSNGPELKNSGVPWTTGEWGGWTPIGAEATVGGYEVAFKLTGSDLYTVWNTDSNGTITSNAIASVSGSDASLQSIETSFQQDLNRDGVIGPPSHTSAASGDSSTAGSATITLASSGFQLSSTTIGEANTFNITIATPPIVAPAAGNAVLAGTADSDTFVFSAHFGNDTVTGFQPGVDQVNLDHTLFASVADLLTHTSDNAAGSAVVSVEAGQSITFDHVSTQVLQQHASDFHLV